MTITVETDGAMETAHNINDSTAGLILNGQMHYKYLDP
jgi:hypothetical protein